eukprot:11939-Heterococcus_DN1.PRE.1
MFRSNTSMMRTARPLIAAAKPAAFESCRAFCVEKRAPACDKPTCKPRALAKKAAPRKVAQKSKSGSSVMNMLLDGFLTLTCALLATAVIMTGVTAAKVSDEPSTWETINCTETIQQYEELIAKGLTPSQELMTRAAVACAFTANGDSVKYFKKALHLIDSLVTQGYVPTDAKERIAWGRAYTSAGRFDEAIAVLQEPVPRNAVQDHYRHFYLCILYTEMDDVAALQHIMAERVGQRDSDMALVRAHSVNDGVALVLHRTYRVTMFAYSGDMQSALAELGQMLDESTVPTTRHYRVLRNACKLNDRLDLLPLIDVISKK